MTHFSDNHDEDEYIYMTKKEIAEVNQTRDDACPECHLVHTGECW